MANEKRLIDANALKEQMTANFQQALWHGCDDSAYPVVEETIDDAPTVYAVEVPDEDLLQAVKLLIKQYQRSKNDDYVHSPVAHALYHTWKQVDERRG